MPCPIPHKETLETEPQRIPEELANSIRFFHPKLPYFISLHLPSSPFISHVCFLDMFFLSRSNIWSVLSRTCLISIFPIIYKNLPKIPCWGYIYPLYLGYPWDISHGFSHQFFPWICSRWASLTSAWSSSRAPWNSAIRCRCSATAWRGTQRCRWWPPGLAGKVGKTLGKPWENAQIMENMWGKAPNHGKHVGKKTMKTPILLIIFV